MSGDIEMPGLEELLTRAKAAMAALSPTERAIMFLRQKVSYVQSEMTCDVNDEVVRTREEANNIVAKTDPALILAELDRRQAEIERLRADLDALLEALKYTVPLAVIALDAHRVERIKAGHIDITFTKPNGEKWVGLYQDEWDKLESAQEALSSRSQQAEGGK